MRLFNYRMNRATFALLLTALVFAYVVMVNTMERVPGAEALVALIAIPRLHDIGRSGWWLLTLFAGEIAAVAIGWQGGTEGILIAGGLYVLFALLVLIVLAAIPGEREPNRWGDPPPGGINFQRPKPST